MQRAYRVGIIGRSDTREIVLRIGGRLDGGIRESIRLPVMNIFELGFWAALAFGVFILSKWLSELFELNL